MAELKTQGIRDALAPLFENPTPHEIILVISYKDCENKYNAIKGALIFARQLWNKQKRQR